MTVAKVATAAPAVMAGNGSAGFQVISNVGGGDGNDGGAGGDGGQGGDAGNGGDAVGTSAGRHRR